MRAIIIANGVLNDPETARKSMQPGDLLIAADGGLHFYDQLGVTPDVLIGDFDSVSAEKVASLSNSQVKVIRYPEKKDFTDLELALGYAQEQSIQDVLIFAALGDRWDQTLANILLPAAMSLSGMRITLQDGPHEIHLIDSRSEPTQLEISGHPGDNVSLIPIGGDAKGITTENLEYPLKNETLSFGATRGMSNILLANKGWVRLEAGLLVCVISHLGVESGG